MASNIFLYMYNLDGIVVSGDHPVFHDNKWKRTRDASDEKVSGTHTVYNLITLGHRIVVQGKANLWTFTDYDEIDDTIAKLEHNINILNSEKHP